MTNSFAEIALLLPPAAAIGALGIRLCQPAPIAYIAVGFALTLLFATHYRDVIDTRRTGIRDFLLLLFLIDLDTRLDFSTLSRELWLAVALSLFVLIGNRLIGAIPESAENA